MYECVYVLVVKMYVVFCLGGLVPMLMASRVSSTCNVL